MFSHKEATFLFGIVLRLAKEYLNDILAAIIAPPLEVWTKHGTFASET